MKQVYDLTEKIRALRCDRELGWLQLRLLVLTLMNALIPMIYSEREIPVEHFRKLQSLYKDYLQVPFEWMDDKIYCESIKMEVLSELDGIFASTTEKTAKAA